MKTQKYSVNQHLTETILSWVKSVEIAIPENKFELEYNGYENFLVERRKLMSKRTKEYYFSL